MKRLLKKVFKRFKQDVVPVEKALPGEYLPQKSLWAPVLRCLEANRGCETEISIPVTKSSFDNYYRFNNDKNPFIRRYDREIQRFIRAGCLYANARIESNIIKISRCLDEGCGPDEDGYGMEPPEYIIAILDLRGNFVVSFTESGLCYYINEFAIIDHLIALDIPALDKRGKINARCEQTANEHHQKIFTRGLCGMFGYSSVKVPCIYKNVELSEKLDDSYSFCVQTANDRYGLVLPYSEKEDIPAIYYSPFKKAGDNIVETTLQDGSEIRFEIKKNDYGKWTVNEVSPLNFKT